MDYQTWIHIELGVFLNAVTAIEHLRFCTPLYNLFCSCCVYILQEFMSRAFPSEEGCVWSTKEAAKEERANFTGKESHTVTVHIQNKSLSLPYPYPNPYTLPLPYTFAHLYTLPYTFTLPYPNYPTYIPIASHFSPLTTFRVSSEGY